MIRLTAMNSNRLLSARLHRSLIFRTDSWSTGLERSLPVLAAVALLLGMHAFVSAADWPAFRGNLTRTGCYPDPVGCPSTEPLWRISLDCEIISSPVIKDDRLYIGARDSCIYSISCKDGTVRWKVKTGGWVDATPWIGGGRIVVGSRDSTIYMLSARSGGIAGRMSAGMQLSSPAEAAGGTILAGLGLPHGGIAAYDPSNFHKQKASPKWSVALPQYTYSSPAVRGQAIVIGATDGRLYCIDSGERDTLWSLPTVGGIYLSTPSIDDTTVYFAPGDDDRNVYAVNLFTGSVLWKSSGAPGAGGMEHETDGKMISPRGIAQLLKMSPALRRTTIERLRAQGILLPRMSRRVQGGLSKRAASGDSEQFVPSGGMKTSSTAVGPDNVYVIQKDLGFVINSGGMVEYLQQFTIRALDKSSGSPVWSFSDLRSSPPLGYCSSPVVTSNLVFFGWGEGRMYGFETKSGRKVWEDSLEGHIISSPAIADGKLYVATTDGFLYAFALRETMPGLDLKTSTYCYPNPARIKSSIQYYLPKGGDVEVRIYDAAERLVKIFKRKSIPAGTKDVFSWNLSSVANGVYFGVVTVNYRDGSNDRKILKIAVLR